jgi:predicted DNA-binding transcriptional regulator YafY
MPRGGQLARQWRLLQLIDRPAGITVDAAAADLGCTVRTVWRDLRVLEHAGFPLYDEKAPDGRRGLWKIDEGFRGRLPLKLSLSELAALVMSRTVLTATGAGLLGPAVRSAFERIAGVLSRDALRLLDQMREHVGVRVVGAKLQLPAAEHVPLIQQAMIERRRLQLSYYSMSRDAETRRAVDPYRLTVHDGGLYLVGHCHLRGAPRIFAVERIRALEVLRARFEPPAGFDVDAYLDGALGIIQGEIVRVRVVFARELARYIRERLWHPTQRVRDLEDGRLELTLRVADTLEVRRWLLGFGVQAEVVEPAALREAIRGEAAALAARPEPTRMPLMASRRLPGGPRARAL